MPKALSWNVLAALILVSLGNFCCKYIGKAGKKRRNGRKINLEEIINITENKKKYLELLLLGDEKEEMIDRYLERGDMYVLKTPLGMALCVVTDEGDGVLELKNIAVEPVCQKKGIWAQADPFYLSEI